jgi:hypothetical protein
MTRDEAYVTAAYLVFLGVLLLYVVVYSAKMARLEREVTRLAASDPPRELEREAA